MPARDWSKLYKQYRGQWVALNDDGVSVIASAPTLPELLQKAAKLGHAEPHVAKMPTDLRIFVG